MADIVLTLTIKDVNRDRVMASMNYISNKTIELSFKDHGKPIKVDIQIEDLSQYGNGNKIKRVLKSVLRGIVKLSEIDIDRVRYETDIRGVNPPTATVPDIID